MKMDELLSPFKLLLEPDEPHAREALELYEHNTEHIQWLFDLKANAALQFLTWSRLVQLPERLWLLCHQWRNAPQQPFEKALVCVLETIARRSLIGLRREGLERVIAFLATVERDCHQLQTYQLLFSRISTTIKACASPPTFSLEAYHGAVDALRRAMPEHKAIHEAHEVITKRLKRLPETWMIAAIGSGDWIDALPICLMIGDERQHEPFHRQPIFTETFRNRAEAIFNECRTCGINPTGRVRAVEDGAYGLLTLGPSPTGDSGELSQLMLHAFADLPGTICFSGALERGRPLLKSVDNEDIHLKIPGLRAIGVLDFFVVKGQRVKTPSGVYESVEKVPTLDGVRLQILSTDIHEALRQVATFIGHTTDARDPDLRSWAKIGLQASLFMLPLFAIGLCLFAVVERGHWGSATGSVASRSPSIAAPEPTSTAIGSLPRFAGTASTTSPVVRSSTDTPSLTTFPPVSPTPANGAVNVPCLCPTFRFPMSVTAGCDLYFRLELGSGQIAGEVGFGGVKGTTVTVNRLHPATTYYWHLRLRDTRGNVLMGPVWQFTTEPNQPTHPSASPWHVRAPSEPSAPTSAISSEPASYLLRESLKGSPPPETVLSAQALLYRKHGQWEKELSVKARGFMYFGGSTWFQGFVETARAHGLRRDEQDALLVQWERSNKTDVGSAKQLASSYRETGDTTGAMKLLQDAIESPTASMKARSDAARELGDLELHVLSLPNAAEDSYRKAVRLDSANSLAHVRLGGTLAARGDWTRAAEEYDPATRLEPTNWQYWGMLGVSRLNSNDLQGALAAFTSATQLGPPGDPNVSDAWLGQASVLARLGKDWKQVLACLDKAEKLTPGRPEVCYLYAAAIAISDPTKARPAYEKAFAAIEKALSLTGERALLLFMRSEISASAGNIDAAIADLRKVTQKTWSDAEPGVLAAAWMSLGQTLLDKPAVTRTNVRTYDEGLAAANAQRRTYDEALAALTKASQLAPDNAEVWNLIGRAHRNRYLMGTYDSKYKDELSAAVTALETATQIQPTSDSYWVNLGALFHQRSIFYETTHWKADSTKAACALTIAIRLNPKNASAWKTLGDVRSAQGKQDEAISCYRRATREEPTLCTAWEGLATTLTEKGALNEAADAYLSALAIDPTEKSWWAELGVIRIRQKNSAKAVEAFHNMKWQFTIVPKGDGKACYPPFITASKELVDTLLEATKLYPRDAGPWIKIGEVRVSENKPMEALAAFRKATQADPGSTQAWRSLAKLDRMAALSALANLEPSNAEIWEQLGQEQAFRGRVDEALRSYDRVTRLQPRLFSGWCNFAIQLRKSGRVLESAAAFAVAVKLNPQTTLRLDYLEAFVCLVESYDSKLNESVLTVYYDEWGRGQTLMKQGDVGAALNAILRGLGRDLDDSLLPH